MGRPSALMPFLPLGVLAGLLLAAGVLAPWDAPVAPPGGLSSALPTVEEARGRFVTPTTLATAVVWERAEIELSAASSKPRTTWYVVAYTRGAGVPLRVRPGSTESVRQLPEGALLLEIGVYIDPSWKHVWVAPDGPGGWLPSEFVAEMP